MRRSAEELGVLPTDLAEIGTVTYDHLDSATGLEEHEYNHLFVGRVHGEVRPDPREVKEVTFVGPCELAEMKMTRSFSVWFPTVLEHAVFGIRDFLVDASW
jgi:isopentenyl-diphosphate delta-isomerase